MEMPPPLVGFAAARRGKEAGAFGSEMLWKWIGLKVYVLNLTEKSVKFQYGFFIINSEHSP